MLPRRRLALGLAAAAGLAGAALILTGRRGNQPGRTKPPPAATDGADAAEALRRAKAEAQELGAAHGLVIGFGAPSSFHVPPFLPADAAIAGVEIEPARPAALAPALAGIRAGLARYPHGFVSRLIKAVFIGGPIRIDGAPAGGTYGPAWIVLSAPEQIGAPSIERTCRLGVHHELSSFVYLIGDLSARWRATEPPGWRFAASAAHQLQHGSALAPMQEGFLSPYGASSSENDFNVYAETLFDAPDTLRRLARQFPTIALKRDLIRAAYVALDARLEPQLAEAG